MALTTGEFLALMNRETGDFPADALLAQEWMQHRYAKVLESFDFSFLRTEAIVSTVAEITAGTVAVTNGSTSVTESVADANGWTSAVENRYFRQSSDNEFYLISTFTDGAGGVDTLTLNRNYEGTTGTGVGYRIFQRLYSLASNVRKVIHIQEINNPEPLLEVSQTELDIAFPNRPTVGSPVRYWCHSGRDSSNNLQIEVYPIPDEAVGLIYHYIQTTPDIRNSASATILPQVTYGLLRSGWLADYWSWRSTRLEKDGTELQNWQAKEQEFNSRLQDLLVREMKNAPPQKLKFAPRYIRHRLQRQMGRVERNVTLP